MEELNARLKVKTKMGGRVELAADLVENILARLSVKSLMRFKCVDRSWNILFKTPIFVNDHLQIHQNKDSLMASSSMDITMWYILNKNSSSCIDPRDLFSKINLERSTAYEPHTIIIQGHCNGIFCISALYLPLIPCEGRLRKLILWNPATREVKVVPPPPMPSNNYDYNLYFGFGVDPNSNDLKVVNIITYDENNHPPHVVLYSLFTNSWTIINTIDAVLADAFDVPYYQKCFFANGACYWFLSHDSFCGYRNILCFDFRNNQFHTLKHPPTSMGYCRDFITEVNDSTAYVVHCHDPYYYNSFKVEIWILEQDKWIKKYTFPQFKFLEGLCAIWKGGAEFIGLEVGGGGYVSFNSNCECVCNLDNDARCYSQDVVHNYVESVVCVSF